MHEAPISSYGALSRPTPAVRSYCLHQSAVEDVHGFVAVLIIQSLLRPPVLSVLVPVPELSAQKRKRAAKGRSLHATQLERCDTSDVDLAIQRVSRVVINTCFLFFCEMLIIQFLFSSLR